MSKFFKKFVLTFFSALIFFLSIAPYFSTAKAALNDQKDSSLSNSQDPSSSAGTWYNQDFSSWADKVYNSNPSEIFGERYTAAQVEWVIYGLFAFMFKSMPVVGDLALCLISNTNPTSCPVQDLIDELKKIQEQAKDKGAYQNIQNQSLASLVFSANRPISGISYVKERLNKLKLVSDVQAQTQTQTGFGYATALKPIQSFWSAIRNVSYGLFVLISIIFAFLIMFRVKLSPQTVISVQSAIPKIIIALITATFSYAIAGFLVDFMYIVIGIFSMIFAGISSDLRITPNIYFNLMTSGIFNTGIMGYLTIFGVLFFLPIILIVGAGGLAGSFASFGALGLIALLIIIIISAVFLWISVKTLWTLMKTLAIFLLTVIFSPLTLTLGTLLPNFSFGSWVKTIISQLSVFVTTGVLSIMSLLFAIAGIVIGVETLADWGWLKDLLSTILNIIFTPAFGGIISNTLGLNNFSTPGWPPLLGLGGGYTVVLIMWAVSFVLFTMIPKSAELVQSFIQGKPFAYGSAIGEAFGLVSAAWNFYGAPRFKALQERSSTKFVDEDYEKIIEWFNKKRIALRQGTDTGKSKEKR